MNAAGGPAHGCVRLPPEPKEPSEILRRPTRFTQPTDRSMRGRGPVSNQQLLRQCSGRRLRVHQQALCHGERRGRCHLDVGQNQWYHFGVGAPPILVHFSWDWDVHCGYGILTHGHLSGPLQRMAVNPGGFVWTAMMA